MKQRIWKASLSLRSDASFSAPFNKVKAIQLKKKRKKTENQVRLHFGAHRAARELVDLYNLLL